MTVSQLRDRMTEKVVPEKLMPQNIVEFLMDEDAELPELDAFTFLNRLRALGIGSADFLYLLSGCGAPAEAVEKVRKNPAMNLQGLILTLDGAGLTSQDYTRMLYTARQLWERTLTMRLEDEEQGEAADEADIPEENYQVSDDNPEYTEDAAKPEYPADDVEDEPTDNSAAHDEPAAEEHDEAEFADTPDMTEAEEAGASDEAADDIPNEAEADVSEAFAAEETSEFRPIDMEELRRNLIADAEAVSNGETENTSEESSSSDEPENPADEENDEENEAPSQYHRGALITSFAGAAAVFAVAACVGFMGFQPAETVPTRFAADSDEIFAEIYRSYNNGVIGADAVQWSGETSVFGDMLVVSDGSLGAFYSGGMLYTAEPSGISCENADGTQLSAADVIVPPENTEFVYAQLGGDALYAVFSGAECGFVRIDGGKVTYTSEQDGVLTDVIFDDDTVRLGSVYTPPFSESFSSSQTECFLPSLGTGGKQLMAPENILLSGSDGCSYAISAEYSLADGAADGFAALGCPVYASADGFAAMNDGEKGLFISVIKTDEGLSHTAVHTDKFTSAAGGNGVYAASGNDEGGSVVTIYNGGFTPVAALKNFDREVVSLSRSGNMLYISGSDGIFMAADCTNAASPIVISDIKNGKIIGENAVTSEKTSDGLTFSVYSSEGEKVSYTKNLSGDAVSTLAAGSENAFFAADGVYGAAYSWFDGVSVVSEYAVFGKHSEEVTLFDDKTGFTAAFERSGMLCLVYSAGKISSDIHI